MQSPQEYLIVTNNPMVAELLPKRYQVAYEERSYRDVLICVRDLVFAGHRLYTHPLSGSVKPNETPYKSVAVSRGVRGMENDEAMIISYAIETFDKFTPRDRVLTERILRDFQLIDFTLICGALGVDAASILQSVPLDSVERNL